MNVFGKDIGINDVWGFIGEKFVEHKKEQFIEKITTLLQSGSAEEIASFIDGLVKDYAPKHISWLSKMTTGTLIAAKVIVELRDGGHIKIDQETVRQFMNTDKLMALLKDERLSEGLKSKVKSFFSSDEEAAADTTAQSSENQNTNGEEAPATSQEASTDDAQTQKSPGFVELTLKKVTRSVEMACTIKLNN